MSIGYVSQSLSNLNITGVVTPAGVAKVTPGAAVGVAAAQNVSDIINMIGFKNFGITVNAVVNTPASGTFTATAATDLMTKTAHGFYTGLKVQVSNSGGALPGGLTGATDYFVIRIDSDTYKFADTLAHAIAGTNIVDITDAGTGTQTVTPTAIAGAGFILQGSNDQVDWVTDVSQTNITTTALFACAPTNRIPAFKYYRLFYNITAGMMNVTAQVQKEN